MLWRLHADLKPENILIKSKEDDTHIKVADFGVAKTLGYEGLKTFCGSPQYFGAWRRRIVVVARAVATDSTCAAPEVLRRKDTVYGKGRYGKGADMWSLGVITYIVYAAVAPCVPRPTLR